MRTARLPIVPSVAAGLLACLVATGAQAGDPIIAPAQQAAHQPPAAPTSPARPPPSEQPTPYPVHPWERTPIELNGPGEHSRLREEHLSVPHKQPRWTAKPRLPPTRL